MPQSIRFYLDKVMVEKPAQMPLLLRTAPGLLAFSIGLPLAWFPDSNITGLAWRLRPCSLTIGYVTLLLTILAGMRTAFCEVKRKKRKLT